MKYQEYTPLALFLALGILSLLLIRPLLIPLFIGALLAYIFYPLYSKLQKKLPNKTISALIMCISILIILIVPTVFLIKGLVQESYVIFLSVKQRLAIGLFRNCTNNFCQGIANLSQNQLFGSQISNITKFITNWIIQKGSDFLISLPRFILNTFVIFFTMFYFLKDGPAFVQWLHDILSMQQKKYTYVVNRTKDIVHGIVHGYFLVAFIQGAFGALGFYLFGISSPLFWGGVMALLALFPYVGTGFIWVPASLILFFDGIFQDSNSLIFKGIGLFIYSLIFISSSDNILRPRLMGNKAKIHPAIVLIGILGGISMFGILGVIIGPLILSLTTVIIESYIKT